MEPHVFCGPEFILDVPVASVPLVLEQLRAEALPPPEAASASTSDTEAPATSPSPTSASLGWTVQAAALLRVQGELYGVCTADVRRHVHASAALQACMRTDVRRGMAMVSRRMSQFGRIVLPASYGSLSVSGVPPPPEELTFVQAKATGALSPEEAASLQQSVRVAAAAAAPASTSASSSSSTAAAAAAAPSSSSAASTHVLLYVTDSRVAAQLHMLCLRNTFIALPHGCRLLNYFAATGRAAAVVPSQVLQKREVLRSHYNCDAELWGVLEAKLTDELVEQVRQSGAATAAGGGGGGGRLLTPFEQHEQNVKAVLRYCEQHVRYAGVFDDDEEASPFLLAMGLCWRLGITMDDVCRHFARHPRRVVRALALYLARYTLAPEDYVYVFTPSLCDEVVIACTQDLQVTLAMKELSRQLLTKNDIVDAWLPILAKPWQDGVVAPAMSFMEACWRLQTQPGGSGEDGGTASTSSAAAAGGDAAHLFVEADGTAGGQPGEVEAHGEGRGIAAAFGFRSIAEIAEHAAQHARVLVPQSIATILKRRRGLEDDVFGGGEGAGEDVDAVDVLGDDEDDDDFLIRVDVRGDDGDADGGGRGLAFPSTAAKRARTGDGKDGAGGAGSGGGGAVLDPHRRIMREGLKLILSLLGRRTLFRTDDEHYIEF